jgi:uncharacterized protein YdaU (DUF1376 family)
MALEKSPAFQFYIKEWRSSRAVQRMSFAERGMYLEMLMEQWERFSLPDDAAEVAALIATSKAQVAEIMAAWPTLRRNFVADETMVGRIINEKLERVRQERKRYLKAVKKGGKARATSAIRSEKGTFQPSSGQPAITQLSSSGPPADHPGLSSTASASSSASATASASASARVLDSYRAHWKRTYHHDCSLLERPLDIMQLEQQIGAHSVDRVLSALQAYFTTEDPYVIKARHPLPMFLRDPLKYLAKDPATKLPPPHGCRHDPPCPDSTTHTRKYLAEQRAS